MTANSLRSLTLCEVIEQHKGKFCVVGEFCLLTSSDGDGGALQTYSGSCGSCLALATRGLYQMGPFQKHASF